MAIPAAPKAWGAGGGAWADDVAQEEAQTGVPLPAPVNESAYPSLAQAKDVVVPKGKKVKATKMSLSEFTAAAPFRSHGPPKVSDEQIRATLPTGSRGKVEGEEQPLPGGFRDYGGDRGDRGGFGAKDRDGAEGKDRSGFGFDSSKADSEDVWSKTFQASDKPERRGAGGFGGGGGGFDREGGRDREGGGGGGGEEDRGPSAADTSNSWGNERKFEASAAPARSGGAFGGDRRGGADGERGGERGGFGGDRAGAREYSERAGPPLSSKADEEDVWGRSRPAPSERDAAPGSSRPGGADRKGFGFSDGPGRVEDEGDKWSRRPPAAGGAEPASTSSGGGGGSAAAPGERPRLALAARTKPIEPIVVSEAPAAEAAAPAVTTPAAASPAVPAGPPKPRANPFGAARPREEVLKEKGIDVAKADEPRGPEVLALKQEIEALQKRLAAAEIAPPPTPPPTPAAASAVPAPVSLANGTAFDLLAEDEDAASESGAEEDATAAAGDATAAVPPASSEESKALQAELEVKQAALAALEAAAAAAGKAPPPPAPAPAKGMWARAAAAPSATERAEAEGAAAPAVLEKPKW